MNPIYTPVFWAHYVEFLNDQLEMEVTTEIEESEIPREGILVEEEDLIFPIEDIPVAEPVWYRQDDDFECDTIPPTPERIRRESTVSDWHPSIANILLGADVAALLAGLPDPGSRDNPIDLTDL